MEKNARANEIINVDEAIKIIEADTRKNATVDIQFLVNNVPAMREGRLFNIKLKKHVNGKVVDNGNKFAAVETEWDRSRLTHTIMEHHKDVLGIEIDPKTIGVKSMTTSKDEDVDPTGQFRKDNNPMTKFGETTEGGDRVVTTKE